MKTAVMLLAHGTKEVDASQPVHQYAEALAKATGKYVVPCLREFIEPSVPTVVKELVEKGFQRIVVVPMFLFNSRHVTRDITNNLAEEKKKYPDLVFEIGEPFGYDELMIPLLQRRLEEVLSKSLRT